MKFNTVMEVLDAVSQTTKSKEKVEILSMVNGHELESTVKRVFLAAYDKRYSFYLKSWSEVEDAELTTPMASDLDGALDFLFNHIDTRLITGSEAKNNIYTIYKNLSEDDAEVFKRVVLRDLRCGVSGKTINKVFPGLVYIHPYMRCSSFSEKNLKKISFPCLSQVKMDGLYVDLIVSPEGELSAHTRNGRDISYILSDSLKDAVRNEAALFASSVFSGECLIMGDDEAPMKREDGNGALNRDEVDPSRVLFYVWDWIEYQDWLQGADTTRYEDRLATAQSFCDVAPNVSYVTTKYCNTVDDILEHFREARSANEEGTVVKNVDGKWKDGTSPDQVKIKVVTSSEVRVVGWDYGTGKYEHVLGKIHYESTDGKVKGSVGTGFSDNERSELVDTIDSMISDGLISEIRYNDLVANDDGGYSLFLPRHVEFRTDKNEADSYDDILAQIESATEALDMIQ